MRGEYTSRANSPERSRLREQSFENCCIKHVLPVYRLLKGSRVCSEFLHFIVPFRLMCKHEWYITAVCTLKSKRKENQMERQDGFCWSFSPQENLFDKLKIWAQKTALVFMLERGKTEICGAKHYAEQCTDALKRSDPSLGTLYFQCIFHSLSLSFTFKWLEIIQDPLFLNGCLTIFSWVLCLFFSEDRHAALK